MSLDLADAAALRALRHLLVEQLTVAVELLGQIEFQSAECWPESAADIVGIVELDGRGDLAIELSAIERLAGVACDLRCWAITAEPNWVGPEITHSAQLDIVDVCEILEHLGATNARERARCAVAVLAAMRVGRTRRPRPPGRPKGSGFFDQDLYLALEINRRAANGERRVEVAEELASQAAGGSTQESKARRLLRRAVELREKNSN